MAFMDFVISPYFIPIIVMGVLNIFFVPFGIVGIKNTFKWFNRNYMKPRQGYISVRQKLPNDRMVEFLVKPTGEMIKFRPFGSQAEITIPFKNEKGWVAFDGNLPVIELDDNNQQKRFDTGEKSGISQEEITRAIKVAYETGKILGSSDFLSEIKKWLMIVLVVCGIGVLVSFFFGMSINNAIKKLPTADTISKTTIDYWFNQTGYPRYMQQQITATEQPQNTGGLKIPFIGG
jgi:hypothetical protein